MFDVRIKWQIRTLGGNAKVKTGAKEQTLDDLLGKPGPRAVSGWIWSHSCFSHPVAIASSRASVLGSVWAGF